MGKVVIDGKTYFGYDSSILKNESSFHKLVNLNRSNGYIVKQQAVEEWRFLGFHNENNPVLYGPYFEGISLEDALKQPAKQGLVFIERLVNALEVLDKNNNVQSADLPELQLDSVFFLKNGEVLFLPFQVIKNIRYIKNDEYKIKNYKTINHPYNNSHSWTIASLIYKILTGVFPYQGNTEEEINNKIRNQKVIPIFYKNFEIKKEISDIITSSFNDKNISLIKLTDWNNYIRTWLDNGINSNITIEQKMILEKESEKLKIKNDKSYKQKLFMEKNKTKISIITISVIIFSLLLFSFLKHNLRPRVTKGFTPIQVVETFYNSINKLDHITMDDCVKGKSGKDIIQEVLRVFAISKQAEAYSHQLNIVMADKWEKMGRIKLESPRYVYGITNLKITTENDNTFLVNYEKWQPVPGEESSNIVNYEGFKKTDRVFLKLDKKDWIIYKIDRLKSELISE